MAKWLQYLDNNTPYSYIFLIVFYLVSVGRGIFMNNKTVKIGKSYAMVSFITIILYVIMSSICGYDLEGPSLHVGGAFCFVQGVLWMVAAFCAYIYFGNGGRKEDAKLYKAFAWNYVITQVIATVVTTLAISKANAAGFTINGGVAICEIMVLIVSMLVSILLAFVKNLGKKNSTLLVIVCVLCGAATVLLGIMINGVLSGAICGGLSRILLALTMYELVKGKYQDKDARGTI